MDKGQILSFITKHQKLYIFLGIKTSVKFFMISLYNFSFSFLVLVLYRNIFHVVHVDIPSYFFQKIILIYTHSYSLSDDISSKININDFDVCWFVFRNVKMLQSAIHFDFLFLIIFWHQHFY